MDKNTHNVLTTLGTKDGSTKDRQAEDFYSTPEYVTDKICEWLKENIPESANWKIWEPACGNGRMVNSLKNNGFNVTNFSDIVDRGVNNVEILDFLNCEKNKKGVNCIFTNPPYSKATEFAEKALSILEDDGYYIFLGRIQFLEGKKRKKLFKKYPPKYVLIFSERVNCWKDDKKPECSGALCYAFFIFKKDFNEKPTIDWL